MEKLFEIQSILLQQLARQPIYQRAVFNTFIFDNQINCIMGARGIGKTTFLLDYINTHYVPGKTVLYVSADNLFFLEINMVQLVDTLYKETDIRLLCIDEIHKQSHWQQQLKNIADTYLDFKIIFTGSSQIDLVHSQYDLSRRVTMYYLPGLSFREYLEMRDHCTLPTFTLEQLIIDHAQITSTMPAEIIKDFHRYLQVGYYPFFGRFSEDIEKYQAIHHIVQKIIYEDIASFHALKTTSLMIIENLFKFILSSAPGELNAYKLASNLKKDFDSISNYLLYLQQAGLVRFLYSNKAGQAYLRNPTKMYPENPNLLFAAYLNMADDNLIGKARETFVLNQLQNAGIPTYFSPEGDFDCGGYLLEIGGKNKTTDSIRANKQGYVFADGILTGFGKKLPLYLLGFLG
ncbi:MAG: AAA family ATPase [Gammaproteobacteria bacterium]|nr:AAA family ATPase [Gammaproteobacteria bacterium]